MARRMAGSPDGSQRPPGEVDRLAVLEQDVGDGHGDHGLDGHRRRSQIRQLVVGHAGVGQELRHGGHQLVGVSVAGLEHLGVGGVESDPGPGGLTDPSGQPVVVRMDVGDHHRPDVRDTSPGGGQPVIERRPCHLGVPSGIHKGHAASGQLQGIDQHVAQRIVRDGDRDRPQARPHLLHGRHDLLVPGSLLRCAGDDDHDRHGTRQERRGGPSGPPTWSRRPEDATPALGPGGGSLKSPGRLPTMRPSNQALVVGDGSENRAGQGAMADQRGEGIVERRAEAAAGRPAPLSPSRSSRYRPGPSGCDR